MKIRVQTLTWAGDIDLEPAETLKAAKVKLQAILGFPEEEMLLTVGGTALADDARTVEDYQLTEGSEVLVTNNQKWTDDRFEALKALFLKHGNVHAEALGGVGGHSHDATLPAGLELPAILRALLQHGAEWHFHRELHYCNLVFRCNSISKDYEDYDVFGSKKERNLWIKHQRKRKKGSCGPDSCAGSNWALICVMGDYHYIFVNLCKDSPLFGATRHVVNNCDEEEHFTDPPFGRFLDVVEAFAKAHAPKSEDELVECLSSGEQSLQTFLDKSEEEEEEEGEEVEEEEDGDVGEEGERAAKLRKIEAPDSGS